MKACIFFSGVTTHNDQRVLLWASPVCPALSVGLSHACWWRVASCDPLPLPTGPVMCIHHRPQDSQPDEIESVSVSSLKMVYFVLSLQPNVVEPWHKPSQTSAECWEVCCEVLLLRLCTERMHLPRRCYGNKENTHAALPLKLLIFWNGNGHFSRNLKSPFLCPFLSHPAISSWADDTYLRRSIVHIVFSGWEHPHLNFAFSSNKTAVTNLHWLFWCHFLGIPKSPSSQFSYWVTGPFPIFYGISLKT